ncbi:Putative rad21/Rec8-like protein [Septoria linicola]|uniref:Rad21/Rec8-like protein n=1 Tax=Septoria linicola TaxID=215465 RepID=A0A9Q9EG13_9PEZI|nr:Putative rad21/Rec8-like protein [Septoria linicola]
MFYSHEVLTSRKYGVATVWLVATLGARSTLKKVTKKAILNVDVAKACETIVTPEAPMALRLQSNLLYGVTRVYAQQCGYVLTDAEAARNSLRVISRAMKQAELEPEGATKGQADQLELQDDPNFTLDFDLMPDPDMLIANLNEDTQVFSQSPAGDRSLTNASQQSIGGLMIPTSNNSFVGGPVSGFDLFSVRGDSGPGTGKVPAQLLDEDDLGLDLGLDMDMPDVESSVNPSTRRSRGPIGTVDWTESVNAGDRFASEQPGQPMLGQDEDAQLPVGDFNFDGDFGRDPVQDMTQHETTSETATAPYMKKARKVTKKAVQSDAVIAMGNRDLAELGRNYLDRMLEEGLKNQQRKLNAIAKTNAEHWVLGAGTILGQGLRGPLDIFSGAAILEAFTGFNLLTGKKRPREEVEGTDGSPSKRSRMESPSDEIGRAQGDQLEDDFLIMGDDTIEQGRDAPTPLDDRHLSSLLPWNQSQGSRRPTDIHQPTSASFGGGIQLNLTSRRGSRLTSASPLINRGTFDAQLDDFQLPPGSDLDMSGLNGGDEFELFGAAAQVDTQTAAQTQWQKAALTGESANFLDFVQAAIDDNEDLDQAGKVDLDGLLPPESNSHIVAAQAFLHVLTLGTRGALKVEQEEPFGSIVMSVIAGAA